MNKRIYKLLFFIITLFACVTLSAQNNLSVESFTEDETDQDARITFRLKDQNDKVCAIVKIETPLLLQDFTFDAGMMAVIHSEQKKGEIWLWLSPSTQRLTIQHTGFRTIRNYSFGEALKEATVYIMKLKSGKVTTIIEEPPQQYFEITCAADGATIKIDDAAPELFIDGKFRKLLSYGKHKYTVEAPKYHPENGITEITEQKADPIFVVLKPKFGKITVNTQPEHGADVFIDDEKKGQSPLTIEGINSGQHTIRVTKPQFRPVIQEITITDGATESVLLTMPPNFAIITLTTPDGEDIYINDEKKATARWSGRLTHGQYKVELRKASHRPSVKTIEVMAGIDKTIQLDAPTPIYGSLDIQANMEATIFIDEIKQQSTTPYFINKILIGKHVVELQATGYKPYHDTVEIEEGKTELIKAPYHKEPHIEINNLCNEAENLFKNKQYEKAKETYSKALKIDPNTQINYIKDKIKEIDNLLLFLNERTYKRYDYSEVEETAYNLQKQRIENELKKFLLNEQTISKTNIRIICEIDTMGVFTSKYSSSMQNQNLEKKLEELSKNVKLSRVFVNAHSVFVKAEFSYTIEANHTIIVVKKNAKTIYSKSGNFNAFRSDINSKLIYAPLGKYTFDMNKVTINNKEYKDNQLIKMRGSSGASNAFLSILVPGLGVHRVTGGEKKGLGMTLSVYGIMGASIGCKFWSNSEYKKYHDATEQSAMDKHYNMANGLNKTFYIGMAIGVTVWLYDIIWVTAKGAKNKKEQKTWQQRNLGFYYNPKLNVSGLSYTINF